MEHHTSILPAMAFFKKIATHKVCTVLIAAYVLQLAYTLHRQFVPVYTDHCGSYQLAVYRETSMMTYFPFMGYLYSFLQGDQTVVLKKELDSGRSWELRVGTGEAVIDWSNTYMQVTNPDTMQQRIQVMDKSHDPGTPDMPILSAMDYAYHHL